MLNLEYDKISENRGGLFYRVAERVNKAVVVFIMLY